MQSWGLYTLQSLFGVYVQFVAYRIRKTHRLATYGAWSAKCWSAIRVSLRPKWRSYHSIWSGDRIDRWRNTAKVNVDQLGIQTTYKIKRILKIGPKNLFLSVDNFLHALMK